MSKAPVIFKIKFYSPDNNKDAQGSNSAHITYIATKPETVENDLNTPNAHLKYIDERPGSGGLFDINEVVPNIDDIKNELKQYDGIVWRSVISLREDDAVRLGYIDRKKWETTMRKIAPDIAKSMGISESNLRWVAAFHLKKGHPHVHFVFWEKEHQRQKGCIGKNERKNIKQILTRELFAEERTKLYAEKTALRDAVSDLAKDDLKKTVDFVREIKELGIDLKELEGEVRHIPPILRHENEKELANMLVKLSDIMPNKGRIAFKYMPEDVKNKAMEISEYILKQPGFIQSVNKIKLDARILASHYTRDKEKLNEAESNAYMDLKKRVSQVILKAAAESQKTNIFTIDKEKAEKTVEVIKKLGKVNTDDEKNMTVEKYVCSLKVLGLNNEDIKKLTNNFISNNNVIVSNKFVEECINKNKDDKVQINSKVLVNLLKASGVDKVQAEKIISKYINQQYEFEKLIADSLIERKDGVLFASEKLKGKILNEKKPDKIEMILYENFKGKDSFTIDDVLKDENIKNSISKNDYKEFSFGKYDTNVVFRYFKNNVLDKSTLIKEIREKHKDLESIDKEFNIVSKRLDKLESNGYVSLNDGKYSITEKGINEADKIRKNFIFTSYDANVIFGYINKSNGCLSKNKLIELLQGEYSKEEINKQYNYILKRINKNIEYGYISENERGFYATEKGTKICEEILYPHKDKVLNKIESLKRLGLIIENNNSFKFTENFNNLVHKDVKKDKKVENLDEPVYKLLTANDGILNEEEVSKAAANEMNSIIDNYVEDTVDYNTVRDVLGIKGELKETVKNMAEIVINSGNDKNEAFNIINNWNLNNQYKINEDELKNIIDNADKKFKDLDEWGRKTVIGKEKWINFFKRFGLNNNDIPEWMYKYHGEGNKKNNEQSEQYKNNTAVKNTSLKINTNKLWRSAWKSLEREKAKSEAKTEKIMKRVIVEEEGRNKNSLDVFI